MHALKEEAPLSLLHAVHPFVLKGNEAAQMTVLQ